MRKETLQVCFGCLLHDIGKLVYRAGGESGSHSRQGWDFLRQLWPEEREILDCVRLHHAAELRQAQPPADSPAWIACAADNLSAAADRREAGRDGVTKSFVEKARLLQYLKGIGKDREDLIRFAHYMEALVAYHRYYGGKEN